jgi:hypothetical protein
LPTNKKGSKRKSPVPEVDEGEDAIAEEKEKPAAKRGKAATGKTKK